MLESLEIRREGPMENYRYKWISAVAHYAVDPDDPANARIADLGLAPRGHDGKVRFSGDVVLLRPDGGGNRRASCPCRTAAMYACRSAVRASCQAGVRTPPSPGDGYLLDHGWTIAIPGWQWDVPRDMGLAGFDAPVADAEPGWMRSDFRVETPMQERSVGDTLPVVGGGTRPAMVFTPYPASGRASRRRRCGSGRRSWGRPS